MDTILIILGVLIYLFIGVIISDKLLSKNEDYYNTKTFLCVLLYPCILVINGLFDLIHITFKK